MATPSRTTATTLTIKPPNFQTAVFRIVGTAPYVQNKFSQKAQQEMEDVQKQGSTAKKGAAKKPKDFDAMYEGAKHIAIEGWVGMPASGFRNAMISACKIVGFHMTKAKLCIKVEADGYGSDGTPLVKIIKGDPWHHRAHVRLKDGSIDIHSRPMWDPNWEVDIRVRFDADMFTLSDVSNLLMRVGMQVGIGEGRNDSKNSSGMGWGEFIIKDSD